MRLALLGLTLILFSPAFGQQGRTLINGEIHYDSIPVENAHVINKTAQIGSVTNQDGSFSISAKKGDTLMISELQYKVKLLVLSAEQVASKSLRIELEEGTNELAEVIVRQYDNMAEQLNLPNAGKEPLNKLERNLNKYSQRSTARVIMDMLLFKPGGIDDLYNIISGNRKTDRKLKSLIQQDRIREEQIAVSKQIRAYLKDEFFTSEIGIGKDDIQPYILSCMPKGISRLFREERMIEVIDILLKNKVEFQSSTSENAD